MTTVGACCAADGARQTVHVVAVMLVLRHCTFEEDGTGAA